MSFLLCVKSYGLLRIFDKMIEHVRIFGLLMDWERPRLLEGAEAYCRDNGIWFDCRWSQRPDWFHDKEAKAWDGALVHLNTSRSLLDLLAEEQVPVVGLRSDLAGCCSISSDFEEFGRIAADELIRQGCKRVFMKQLDPDSHEPWNDFITRAKATLIDGEVLVEQCKFDALEFDTLIAGLEAHRGEKLGLLNVHAGGLTKIQLALMERGWELPNELMMVVVDKDAQGIAQRAPIPLTAVDPDYWKQGHDGMKLLDELSRGETPIERSKKIKPLGLTRRLSTGFDSQKDKYVWRLVELIERSAFEQVGVGELMDRVGMSRRGIEVRFRKALNCSPLEYLTRHRLERVKEFLRSEDSSLAVLAERCGFSDGAYLSRIFKKVEKMTPGEYRARFRSEK